MEKERFSYDQKANLDRDTGFHAIRKAERSSYSLFGLSGAMLSTSWVAEDQGVGPNLHIDRAKQGFTFKLPKTKASWRYDSIFYFSACGALYVLSEQQHR